MNIKFYIEFLAKFNSLRCIYEIILSCHFNLFFSKTKYIFVNPLFRKKGFATKLLKLVKNKIGKKIILQKPISPLGMKLLKSLEKWL